MPGTLVRLQRIDNDDAAVGFHAELLEAEILDIAGDPDRRDDTLDGDRLRASFAVVDGRGHAVGFFIEPGDLGTGENLDALLLERLAGEGGDLGILDREDLRQHLDHRHLGAERAIEARELDADRSRADDQQRLRHALRHHRLEIGPDELLVRLEPGQHPGPGAGRENDVLGLIGAGAERALGGFAFRRFDGDLARGVDCRLAPDHGDLVLLHQETDAIVEALGHGARACHHGGRIVGDLLGRQAVILGVSEIMEDSAERSSALVGMQPQLRQMPPR